MPSAIFAVVLLAAIAIVDQATGPALNLAVIYFLPIIYVAWSFGRAAAILAVIVSVIPGLCEHMALAAYGQQSAVYAASTIFTRFFVYSFVAEVTIRLVESRNQAKRSAQDLEKLNSELRTTFARLEEDIAAGGLLQETVLAFDVPSVPGCEVGARLKYAWRVGGDFVDCGVVDGRVYVCVADISGKGTPAALFTALLKHLLMDAHIRGLRGGDVVASLNPALCRSLPSEQFITLFYAEIDPIYGRVLYTNAGHLDGIVYRHGSSSIEALSPTAPLLAVSETLPDTLVATAWLDDDDVLVLYTDGATDSKTETGDRIGEDGLRVLVRSYAHLSPQEMADRLFDEIEEVSEGGVRDDIAIVCIKKSNALVSAGASRRSSHPFHSIFERES